MVHGQSTWASLQWRQAGGCQYWSLFCRCRHELSWRSCREYPVGLQCGGTFNKVVKIMQRCSWLVEGKWVKQLKPTQEFRSSANPSKQRGQVSAQLRPTMHPAANTACSAAVRSATDTRWWSWAGVMMDMRTEASRSSGLVSHASNRMTNAICDLNTHNESLPLSVKIQRKITPVWPYPTLSVRKSVF